MNPYGNIASGLNPTTSGISDSSAYGVLHSDVIPSTAGQMSSSQLPSSDPLQAMLAYAQNNPEYYEVFLQNLAERYNTNSAYQWYEKMSNTSYQRQVEDLKKAGLNPWLALQSMAGASSGSVSPAGTSSTSAYSSKVAQSKNNQQAILGAVGAVLSLAMILAMVG